MDMEGVVVGQVVEAEEREERCTGASTPDEMHSTEVAAKLRIEMNEQLVGHDIEMRWTKEEAWTRKDEQGGPKKVCEWIGWGCNNFGMSLASPAGKVWAHVASFG